MFTTKKLLLGLVAISLSSAVYAEVWTADMRVTSVKVSTAANGNYTCKTIIESSNDDDARNARAIIMLPLRTQFKSFSIKNLNAGYSRARRDGASATCQKSKTRGNINSHVECKLGKLSTKAKLQITIKGIKRKTKYGPSCSVYVTSITPDHKLSNNFKSVVR